MDIETLSTVGGFMAYPGNNRSFLAEMAFEKALKKQCLVR